MPSPALPKPMVSTFVLATQSVLADVNSNQGVPLYHALVLLQHNAWSRIHHVLGTGVDTLSAYAPYLTELSNSVDAAAETVHTVLLLAQDWLAGVTFAACVSLALSLNNLASC